MKETVFKLDKSQQFPDEVVQLIGSLRLRYFWANPIFRIDFLENLLNGLQLPVKVYKEEYKIIPRVSLTMLEDLITVEEGIKIERLAEKGRFVLMGEPWAISGVKFEQRENSFGLGGLIYKVEEKKNGQTVERVVGMRFS